MKSWLKLDNAAKIFPSVTSKYRTNTYRISFTLTEEVDPITLQESLNETIIRFKGFKQKLKTGLFWNYFEENKQMPVVTEENPYINEPFDKYETRGYMFRIFYFHNKITIEVFHSLTDGYGATQFLKAVVYNYLILKGYNIDHEGKIIYGLENAYEEVEDSFQKIYSDTEKVDRTEHNALHFKGTFYEDQWLGVITGIVNKDKFKEVLKKYDCSYTQFVVGTINYCANKCKYLLRKRNNPFQVFVPVDLRRLYPSKSLRNFSMIVKTSIYLQDELSLSDYINLAKEQLVENLKKENLLPRVIGNVKLEKLFILRIVPLFIKKIAFKIGYSRMSTKANSFCMSNLGEIELPKDMNQYVKKVIFINGATDSAPINLGMTYCNNNVFMTFTSSILEREFQKEFFRVLVNEGLEIVIENNDLEE